MIKVINLSFESNMMENSYQSVVLRTKIGYKSVFRIQIEKFINNLSD